MLEAREAGGNVNGHITMNRISLPQGRTAGSHSTAASVGARLESMCTGGIAGADGFTEGQARLSSWMPEKLSGCLQWLEVFNETEREDYFIPLVLLRNTICTGIFI